ncbi:MAG: hypothetical protein LH631_14585 [Alkalinema sp. CAN_BIN05]|nr:hypothetical protein [Alkalinema sp. CAN_BIN05]
MNTLNTQQTTQSTIAIPSQPIEQPSAWLHNGTSPAELILAMPSLSSPNPSPIGQSQASFIV